jgi:hypothetical protein
VIKPLLNAFPLPNGKDLGDGTALFTASYSDPSSLDSYGIRIDYVFSPKVAIFGRYSDVPSDIGQRAAGTAQTNFNTVADTKYRTQTLTLGSNQTITPSLTNELRFNYSRSRAHGFQTIDNFGGGTPPPDSLLFPSGYTPQNANFAFYGDFNPYGLSYEVGELGVNVQRQINVTDSISYIVGAHQMKLGLDYRRLSPKSDLQSYAVQYIFGSLSNVLTNAVGEAFVASRFPDVLAFSNWSLFAQDTWKATRALTVTYGLRWEYNAAPSSPNNTLPLTVTGVDNLATMTLAPPGTPLWKAQIDDFAPRLGIAWQPFPTWVFRAGAGIFCDLGYSAVADGASAFPYVQARIIANTQFPLSAPNLAPLPFVTTPPVIYLAVVNPNHVLPRTYEWNAAVERTFGKADVLTATYVGAAGRKLMRQDIYNGPNPNFIGEFDLMSNNGNSSYQALQAQFRHSLVHGLQTQLSYTWAHAIDNVSSDSYFANVPANESPLSRERGSSDYDIRHTFAGAVSYNIPAPGSGIWKTVFGGWSTDSIVYARTSPPVNVVTGADPFPATVGFGPFSAQRPNLVPGVPLRISDPNVAGGSKINSAAFSIPKGVVQGNLGRNVLSGFDTAQVDLTLRRQFKLRERLSLQARADFFNIFNHPNFASPLNYLSSPQFGQSTQMLASGLGSGGSGGGLNPLYQIGGPRSAQLALKLLF